MRRIIHEAKRNKEGRHARRIARRKAAFTAPLSISGRLTGSPVPTPDGDLVAAVQFFRVTGSGRPKAILHTFVRNMRSPNRQKRTKIAAVGFISLKMLI
jgi:hypothetical protein